MKRKNPIFGGDLYARDAREQLRRWDAGDTIWTIEMGGLGPGYEQAIQVLAIEIVRDEIDKPLPDKADSNWADATWRRLCNPELCGGFSGAQIGAARYLAWNWLKIGPAALCALYDKKEESGAARYLAWNWLKIGPAALCALYDKKEESARIIQASKAWPRA